MSFNKKTLKMEENSKITDTYKAEITDILNKVSIGLANNVIDTIEPKLRDISSIVQSQNDLTKILKEDEEKSLEQINENLEKVFLNVKEFNDKIDKLEKTINHQNVNAISLLDHNKNNLSHIKKNLEENKLQEFEKNILNENKQIIENKIIKIETKQLKNRNILYIILFFLLILNVIVFFLLNKII